ncbi:MAG: Trigger factor [Candidatus Levybacteria bacterium GW2011_GWA1_37_16]|nr:MAG: Trigger factor [Candidatus Levybacteria bacterium GW2011_GWA1_37_16]KKQ42266.1 MAG: Trigger factor [Candidatus Levybacteria bacterium GW2011_GWB1_37_8]
MNKNITTALQKEPNGTIRLTITIPSADVKKTWEEMMLEVVNNAEVQGFRKGKAPRKLVEEKADKEKIREEVLKKLLPIAYTQAVKTQGIKPIINPKIHVEKLADPDTNKDWQFTALTCEAPIIKLGKYKENIQKITAKSKIIIPGKEPVPVKFEDIVKALLDNITAEIPGILVDNETDRLLSQTLEDVKKLGLTLDQYLSSTGKNPQILREEYRKKAENDIKLEFTLLKIAEEEKIVVEEKEIEEAIKASKSDDERKNLEANRYLLASILRQQKTLDFLKNL